MGNAHSVVDEQVANHTVAPDRAQAAVMQTKLPTEWNVCVGKQKACLAVCRLLTMKEKQELLTKWNVSAEDKKAFTPTFLLPMRVRSFSLSPTFLLPMHVRARTLFLS